MLDRTLLADFVMRECELLDRQDYQAWLDLFTPDGTYWVPLTEDQPDPLDHVSLFYENVPLLRMRIGRTLHPNAHGMAEPIRTSRMIGNLSFEEQPDGRALVSARFSLAEWRKAKSRQFFGKYTYLLDVAGPIRMVSKRVDIINSQDPLESIQIIL
jgi:3-phenylpropionate/cinnamic acid dioxygenase small subunit